MVEHVFNRMKHHRKAATRHDETSLANLRLILIAIHLKFFITLYLIFDYPYKYYTFKHFEV